MNLEDVLKYEQALLPVSMFTNTGEMRVASNKAALKNKLKVEITSRTRSKSASVIIDGSALMWVVHWPLHGTVQDKIRNFIDYISSHLQLADTYLIFDSYHDNSIKDITRTSRAGKDASRQH